MVIKQDRKRVAQSVVMLTQEERKLAEQLAERFKGNLSQVFRLGLYKLQEEVKNEISIKSRV